jgi:hypothetical protein
MSWTVLEFKYGSLLTAVKLGQLHANMGLLRGYGVRHVFTVDGTYSKTAGIKSIKVTVIGGGGGGAFVTGGTNDSTSGGGGGCAIKWISADLVANTETVTIGIGGDIASETPNPGEDGGTTYFGSHCYATGGHGGNKYVNNRAQGGIGVGGAVNFRGQSNSEGQAAAIEQPLGGSPGGLISGPLYNAEADSPGTGGMGGKGGAYDPLPGANGIVIIEEYF